MSDNWGVKYNVHVYVEGNPASEEAFGAVAAMLEHFEDQGVKVDFVGVSKRSVKDRPTDQGGT